VLLQPRKMILPRSHRDLEPWLVRGRPHHQSGGRPWAPGCDPHGRDGGGFEPEAGQGSGTQGMTDRLDAIGGRLEIESEPGRGTIVPASSAQMWQREQGGRRQCGLLTGQQAAKGEDRLDGAAIPQPDLGDHRCRRDVGRAIL
jgi:hypothetical protein